MKLFGNKSPTDVETGCGGGARAAEGDRIRRDKITEPELAELRSRSLFASCVTLEVLHNPYNNNPSRLVKHILKIFIIGSVGTCSR